MKTVLITGVSRGIGRALAEKFLKENYFVIGTSVSGKIEYEDKNLAIVALDLSSGESVARAIEEVAALGRQIDILINNAGILADEDETAVVIELLRKTLEVNLIGTIDFTERMLKSLSSESHVIQIASSAGSLTLADHASHHLGHYPSYKISKAALNMYTRTLALRLKESGTIVSSVHPGWVKTDMGGSEADITPEEAAEEIYVLAISKPMTGGFWFKGEVMPW